MTEISSGLNLVSGVGILCPVSYLTAVIVVAVVIAVLCNNNNDETPAWCLISGVGGYVSQLGEQHTLPGPVSKDEA